MTDRLHTPAPWTPLNMVGEDGKPMTAEQLGEYVKNSVLMSDETRFLFVSAPHSDGGTVDVCLVGNGPRGPYNARLIAEAPKMLEMLKTALTNIEFMEGKGNSRCAVDIRAAIAKATGGDA